MGQKVQGSSFSSTTRDVPELTTLQGLVAVSSGARQAPEFAVLQQQALTLQSLLLQRSKPEPEKLRSLLRCSNKQVPELATLQQQASKLRSRRSSGVCCVATASKLRSMLHCSSKQASSRACCVAVASKLRLQSFRSLLRSSSKQAPKLPELRSSRCNASFGALRSSKLAGRAAGSGGLRSSKLSKDV